MSYDCVGSEVRASALSECATYFRVALRLQRELVSPARAPTSSCSSSGGSMVVEGKRQFGAAQHNSVTFMSRHIRSPSVHGWNKEKWRASVSGRRAISYPCKGIPRDPLASHGYGRSPQGSPSYLGEKRRDVPCPADGSSA